MKVGSRAYQSFAIVERDDATPQQVKIREGWLKR